MDLSVVSRDFLLDRARRGCNAATVDYYAKLLRWLRAYLSEQGITTIEAVTTAALEGYIADLRARPLERRVGKLSPVTIRRTTLSLKTFFLWCAGRKLIVADPARAVPTPRSPQRLPKALSADQVIKLLAARMPVRDRAVISLMVDTGLRIGEAVALDVSDLDSSQSTILIRVGKGGKQRKIVFAEQTHEALRDWLAVRESDSPALFVALRGGRLTRSGLYKAIKAAAESAGLYGAVSPHRLRHSFATLALDNGAGLQDVSRMLGHSDLATTAIYFHVSTNTLRDHHRSFSPLDRLRQKG